MTPAALLALRACLAILFLTAAAGKLRHRADFVQGTIEYHVLPERGARLVGTVLPWVELALGLALLAGAATPVACVAAALLLIAFVVAVAVNLARGRSIECNCYGIAGTATTSWATVARNGVLLAMALAVAGLALVAPADAGAGSPWIDLSLPATTGEGLVAVLLLAWCLAVVYLVEWGVDIHLRMSDLRSTLIENSLGGSR